MADFGNNNWFFSATFALFRGYPFSGFRSERVSYVRSSALHKGSNYLYVPNHEIFQ
jgi:hypothetical protein